MYSSETYFYYTLGFTVIILLNVKMPFSWKVGLSIRKSVASCATAGYILTVPNGKQY
jgi:hypothetical protein